MGICLLFWFVSSLRAGIHLGYLSFSISNSVDINIVCSKVFVVEYFYNMSMSAYYNMSKSIFALKGGNTTLLVLSERGGVAQSQRHSLFYRWGEWLYFITGESLSSTLSSTSCLHAVSSTGLVVLLVNAPVLPSLPGPVGKGEYVASAGSIIPSSEEKTQEAPPRLSELSLVLQPREALLLAGDTYLCSINNVVLGFPLPFTAEGSLKWIKDMCYNPDMKISHQIEIGNMWNRPSYLHKHFKSTWLM